MSRDKHFKVWVKVSLEEIDEDADHYKDLEESEPMCVSSADSLEAITVGFKNVVEEIEVMERAWLAEVRGGKDVAA